MSGVKKKPTKKQSLEHGIYQARSMKDWTTAEKEIKKYIKLSESTEGNAFILEQLTQADELISKTQFPQAKEKLEKALQKDPTNSEIFMLLGKISFLQRNYEEALNFFKNIDPKNFDPTETPLYLIRLLLEALYSRGFCYEDLAKNKLALENYRLILNFKIETTDVEIKQIRESAAYRTGVLLLKSEKISSSIEVLRELIFHGITASIINSARKQLGETLLKRCSGAEYLSIENNSAQGLYSPKDQIEEVLILLSLFEESCSLKDEENIAIYDDICLAFCKKYDYKYQIDIFERLLSRHFDDSHFWNQFALSLIAQGKYKRGVFVLKQCISLDPSSTFLRLLAAKICLNHLDEIQHAIDLCNQIMELGGNDVVKAYHILGVAYSKKADQSHSEKKEYQKKALELLHRAYEMDKEDYLIAFHLALQYAEVRDIGNALRYVKIALAYNSTYAHSWNLLALLLSSQKQYIEALKICKIALRESTDLNLYKTKTKLEQTLGQMDQALLTLKEAFATYKTVEPVTESVEPTEIETISEISSIKESIGEESSERPSIIYTHTMSVLSDKEIEEESVNFGIGRIDLWLSAAELFCDIGNYNDAMKCLQEARNLSNSSAEVVYWEGRVMEEQNEFQAIHFYEKTLAINPLHQNSMLHLASLHKKQKQYVLAEKYLLNILIHDLTCHEAWKLLGEILIINNQVERASECFLTATELEETSPILSFSTIRKVI